MAKRATINADNLYLVSRTKAGYTRGEAAELLFVDESTLERYEASKTIPTHDRVLEMEELYDDKALAYRHCTEMCPLGKLHDRIEESDFPTAVLGLISKYNDLGTQLDALIRIAADGKITPDEAEAYSKIEKMMLLLRKKITTLSLCAAV
ncbi:MAG TPA: transcriptional regulator [Pelotomaculum sp.]|nr:transcriptional regulator [Pelotomaculum sp.]